MSSSIALKVRAFLAAHGGVADVVVLCEEAFATRTSPPLARRLLETALPGELQFEDREVTWLPQATADDSVTGAAFLVVDVETTGLHPRNAELIEIGAVRVEGGRVVAEEHTLIRPSGRIPAFIRGLTGIDDAMVAEAPRFHELAPRWHALFADVTPVAHNADFDFRFVDAAFGHCGLAPVGERRLCTMKLARAFAPGPRYTLDAVAERLAVTPDARHRALGDARTTAHVLIELLRRAAESDLHSVEALRRFRKPRSQGAGLKARFGKERIRAIPEQPGIYRFRDDQGQVLYVGKAANLRKRLGGYFIGSQRGKVSRMLADMKDFDYTVVGSELEALLEEAREIRLRQPAYNRALRTWGRYGYLCWDTGDPFPRLMFSKGEASPEEPESARIERYGPFRFPQGGREEVKNLREIFRLRDCIGGLTPDTDVVPCIDHAMQRCGAPCADLESVEAYGARIEALRQFLKGDAAVLSGLRTAIVEASSAEQFERAGVLRDRYQILSDIHHSIRREGELAAMGDRVILLPSGDPQISRLYLLRPGNAIVTLRVQTRGADWQSVTDRLLAMTPTDEPGSLEDAKIAESWLRRRKDFPVLRLADYADSASIARGLAGK